MTRWAMVIDTRQCIGCKACIASCSQVNRIPDGMWRKIRALNEPTIKNPQRYFLTMSCMHCKNPACLEVCPTGATRKLSGGIVDIDQEKCIGCGACIMACPYGAREIYQYEHSFEIGKEPFQEGNHQSDHKQEGTCTKCNFCRERVESGLKNGLTPGLNEAATPFCVVTCSSGALHFGDIDDPDSEVSRLISNNKTVQVHKELKTDPSVYYIIQEDSQDK